MSALDVYRLPESTPTRLVLRGTDDFAPKAMRAGAICFGLSSLYPVYYCLAVRPEVGAAAAAAGCALVSVILFVVARRTALDPTRRTIVDLEARQLWTEAGGEALPPIAFADLGTLKLGSVPVYRGRRGGHRRVSAVTLSRHEGYVLYVPFTDADMLRFVNGLRAVVGEEHLPRAKPGGGGA